MLSYDPDYLELLTDECKLAYQNTDLRTQMEYESLRFKEFMIELKNREQWDEQGATGELALDWGLRKTVYENVDVDGNCTMTNENEMDFTDCMIRYRKALYDAIIRTG